MIRDVDAIILYAEDLSDTVAFYRALGLSLEPQEDMAGEKHYACEMGMSHFAVFSAKNGQVAGYPYRAARGTVIGLQVDKLDKLIATAVAAGATVVESAAEVPWGRRAVICDPEGRYLELNQPRVTGQFPSLPTGTI